MNHERQHTLVNGLACETNLNGNDEIGANVFPNSLKKYCNLPTLNNFSGFEGIIQFIYNCLRHHNTFLLN